MIRVARALSIIPALAAALALWPGAVRATECWTGWGYWIEPASHRYTSERLLLATRGPAAWLPGRPVTLFFLDGERGGMKRDLAPITATPLQLRFSRRQGLSVVTGIATVTGRSDQLSFGLSHIAQSVTGIERLDAFYRWACGLEPGS